MADQEIRAIILTEAGRGRGKGHLSRCFGLLAALAQAGHQARMWVDCEESLPAGISVGDWKRSLDRFLPAGGSRELVTAVDSYEADRALLEAIAARSGRCCFFDDCARLDYPDGVLVNAAVNADSLYPTRRDGLRYLTGPRYTVLQKAFWRSPPLRIRRKVQRVLVTLGSAVTAAKVQEVSVSIRRALPEAQITLLHPVAETAAVRARDGIRWAWETEPERFCALARSSDVAVCAGGQTLLELASLGVPAICLLTAANQKPNALGLQKAGFSAFAGSLDDPTCLDELGALLRKLLSFEVRTQRSRIGRELVDGKGACRVAAELFGDPLSGDCEESGIRT